MPSCERCWTDSSLARYLGDHEAYFKLVEQRGPQGCTPEQQAGPDARECPTCHRMTLHQHCGVCMAGCKHEGDEVVVNDPQPLRPREG